MMSKVRRVRRVEVAYILYSWTERERCTEVRFEVVREAWKQA